MNAEKQRIEDGLARGKTFYLRGGKKLRGAKKKGPPMAAPSADPSAKTDTKGKDVKDKAEKT